MQESEIGLENIAKYTNGRFVYIKDHMNPHKSYAYGHAGLSSVHVKEATEEKFLIKYNDGDRTIKEVLKEDFLKEIDFYDKEKRLKNLFKPEAPEYENIMKFAATTINPYRDLSIKERLKKMEQLLMKKEEFESLEQADLFLIGIERVKKSISFNSYGWLEVNYYANRSREYFLIDRDNERIIISENQMEIEEYIFEKLNVLRSVAEKEIS